MNEFPIVFLQSPAPLLGRKEVTSTGVPTTLDGRNSFSLTWGWGCQRPGQACPVWFAGSKAPQSRRSPRSAGGHTLPGPAARRWGRSRRGSGVSEERRAGGAGRGWGSRRAPQAHCGCTTSFLAGRTRGPGAPQRLPSARRLPLAPAGLGAPPICDPGATSPRPLHLRPLSGSPGAGPALLVALSRPPPLQPPPPPPSPPAPAPPASRPGPRLPRPRAAAPH